MENKIVLMKCGHVANATYDGNPCCAICAPNESAFEILEEDVDLSNRVAKCTDCGKERESSKDLPYFDYQPNKDHDEYYCGCQGWD